MTHLLRNHEKFKAIATTHVITCYFLVTDVLMTLAGWPPAAPAAAD